MTSLRELSRYRFDGRSEQAVREEWVRPLLVHLGYGILTLNEVRYEERLELAAPFRRIGRDRVQVDYRPTVLGHGLWIVEAKAHGAEDWEEALSQAWLYATHPEIDVPFMAIADGSRIAVYDTFRPAWDEPVVEVPTARLVEDFESLSAVLGAENVTNAVRTRRVRHLGDAMQAELSFERLRQYVHDVERLAKEAQDAVLLNQKAILRDQFENEERAQREALAAHGLFAIGVWANQPFGVAKKLSGMARDCLLDTATAHRLQEFDRLRAAATYSRGPNGSPHPRMFWNLRFMELFVCLSARDADGCASFSDRARRAIRDHLLGFPDDPLNRAAHRLERVLPTYLVRLVLADERINLRRLARDLQAHWSDERRLRAGLDGDRLLINAVLDMTQQAWRSVPWEPGSLNELAEKLEAALPAITFDRRKASGLASDPFLEWHYEQDMLLLATLYETGDLITPDLLDDEVATVLERLATDSTDRSGIAVPAARLLLRYRSLP